MWAVSKWQNYILQATDQRRTAQNHIEIEVDAAQVLLIAQNKQVLQRVHHQQQLTKRGNWAEKGERKQRETGELEFGIGHLYEEIK